jgi:hypothetical protein
MARYVRPDELLTSFNFSSLGTKWRAALWRCMIHELLACNSGGNRNPQPLAIAALVGAALAHAWRDLTLLLTSPYATSHVIAFEHLQAAGTVLCVFQMGDCDVSLPLPLGQVQLPSLAPPSLSPPLTSNPQVLASSVTLQAGSARAAREYNRLVNVY